VLRREIRFAADCGCPFWVAVNSLPAIPIQRSNFKSSRRNGAKTFRAVVFAGKPEKCRSAEAQMKSGEHLVIEWNAA
jgi:hypothetical protein